MARMPVAATCARVLLVVVSVSSIIAVVRLLMVVVTFETGALGELITGMLLLAVVSLVLLAAASLVIAARFVGGGSKVRVGAVVVGCVTAVVSAVTALAGHGAWGVGVVVGVLLTVLSAGDGARRFGASRG